MIRRQVGAAIISGDPPEPPWLLSTVPERMEALKREDSATTSGLRLNRNLARPVRGCRIRPWHRQWRRAL